MTTDIDPAFADRCAAAALALTRLSELGSRPETDDAAVDRAAALTATLLADPEALLAAALTMGEWAAVLEARLAAATPPDDPKLVETCRLRDKLRDIYRELPPDDDPRVQAVLAEIRAVWA